MSKPSPKSRPQALRQALQEQTRAAYREAILDAAEQVFLKDGFQSAKMVDVAESTGVSVGTLYNYFESKDAVFLALAERHRTRYFGMLDEPFVATNPMEQLGEFVERTLGFVEQNGALFAIYLRATTPWLDGAVPSTPTMDPEEDQKRYNALLAHIFTEGIQCGRLRDDIPVEELVWALHSLLHAAIIAWVGSQRQQALIDRGRSLVQLFLQGASRK
jgi:AcrR family transcriptional regulator